MTEFETLISVIVALYILECVQSVPAATTPICRSLRNRWSIQRKAWSLDGIGKRLSLSPILPPFGRVLFCYVPQIGMDEGGFWVDHVVTRISRSRPDPLRYFRFSEIVSIDCRGNTIYCDDIAACEFPDRIIAEDWCDFLTLLKSHTIDKRCQLIENRLSIMFNRSKVEARIDNSRKRFNVLRRLCNSQFAVCFVAFPSAMLLLESTLRWLPLLLLTIILGVLISVEYARLSRVVYGVQGYDLWSAIINIVLFPPAAVRAYDQLQKLSLYPWDPLAVVSVISDRSEYQSYVDRRIREYLFLRLDVSEADSSDFSKAVLSFRIRWLRAVESLLLKTGDISRMQLIAPQPQSPDSRSYCPLCCVSFLFTEGTCSDCGIALVSYSSNSIIDVTESLM